MRRIKQAVLDALFAAGIASSVFALLHFIFPRGI